MSASSTPSSCTWCRRSRLPRSGRPVVAVEHDAPGALLGGGEVGRIGGHVIDRHLLDLDARPQIGPPYQPPVEAVGTDPLGRLGAKMREQGVAVGEAGEEVKAASSPSMSTSPSSLRWTGASGSVSPTFEAPSSLQAVASGMQLRETEVCASRFAGVLVTF